MGLRHILMCAIAAAVSQVTVLGKEAPTTIRITGKPLVREVSRLGINVSQGDGAYWHTQDLAGCGTNFEFGLSRRIFQFGPSTPDGLPTIVGVKPEALSEFAGAEFTVISGPSQWTSGKVKAFAPVKLETGAGKTIDAVALPRSLLPADVVVACWATAFQYTVAPAAMAVPPPVAWGSRRRLRPPGCRGYWRGWGAWPHRPNRSARPPPRQRHPRRGCSRGCHRPE